MNEYSRNCFKCAVQYIVNNSSYKNKLEIAKILIYADLMHFVNYGRTITQLEDYKKGYVLDVKNIDINTQVDNYDYLSKSDIQILDQIINRESIGCLNSLPLKITIIGDKDTTEHIVDIELPKGIENNENSNT